MVPQLVLLPDAFETSAVRANQSLAPLSGLATSPNADFAGRAQFAHGAELTIAASYWKCGMICSVNTFM